MPYHRVVSQPEAVAEELARFLGLPLDTAAMAQAVDPALHRQRSALPATPAHPAPP